MTDSSEQRVKSEPITVYGRPNCPMVPPVVGLLNEAKVPFNYVDINHDWEAREQVRTINGGNESVPTLVFPDGSTLTEPGAGALRSKLREQGYDTAAIDSFAATVKATLRNPIYLLLVALLVVLAISMFRT